MISDNPAMDKQHVVSDGGFLKNDIISAMVREEHLNMDFRTVTTQGAMFWQEMFSAGEMFPEIMPY